MLRLGTNVKGRIRSYDLIVFEGKLHHIGKVEFDGTLYKTNAYRFRFYHLIYLPVFIYYRFRYGPAMDS